MRCLLKKDRQCGNKKKHSTKDAAFTVARKIVIEGMNVYKCSSCGYWHIGRSRSKTRQADRIGALLKRHQKDLNNRMSTHDLREPSTQDL